MSIFKTNFRVHYQDTDKMQVVHHANYIRYFETARTEYFREKGFAYSEMEKHKFQMAVLSLDSRYFTPAVYDEELSVSCRITKLAPASIELEYTVCNAATGELHASGHSRHGFLDEDFRPIVLKRKRPELHEFMQKLADEDAENSL